MHGGASHCFSRRFAVLPLRGVLYTLWQNPFYLVSIQMLDGVGAGLFGALFILVVADLTKGTGRFNLAQGAASACFGFGAALSNGVAGYIVDWFGYRAAFLFLAGCAAAAFISVLAGDARDCYDSPPGGSMNHASHDQPSPPSNRRLNARRRLHSWSVAAPILAAMIIFGFILFEFILAGTFARIVRRRGGGSCGTCDECVSSDRPDRRHRHFRGHVCGGRAWTASGVAA